MSRVSFPKKVAGLLVPVFALRHARDCGVGDTIAVRDAIDFCAAHGFSVLQILPIHETVGDHSPYNPISSQALSPSFVALDPEEVPGLTKDMLERAAPEAWLTQLRDGIVKHNSVLPLKIQVLLSAHAAFRSVALREDELAREFARFQEDEAAWLRPYTLFRLLIREYEGNPMWTEWRPEHQSPKSAEAWFEKHPHRERLEDTREGLAFVQWVAWRQWRKVRAHADRRGVMLMGELSFGVSRSSADAWAHPDLFDREWSMGTRPLAFFDTTKEAERWGQNWGLPAYRWENHRSNKFSWLRQRVRGEQKFFHACRLDHLRGYFRTYQFPWRGGPQHSEFSQLSLEEVKKKTGGRLPRFVPGPDDDPVTARMNDLLGRELIGVIREAAGDMILVAEIMGKLPDYMTRALDDLEMPGLTFPQLEVAPDGSPLPAEKFRALNLATYANHDNAPLAALYLHLRSRAAKEPNAEAARELETLLRFAGWTQPPPEELSAELLAAFQRALFATPCQLAVLMSSDLLGNTQRFNLPGSFGRETWCERLAFPLSDFATHSKYGERVRTAARLIAESGRAPEGRRALPEHASSQANESETSAARS